MCVACLLDLQLAFEKCCADAPLRHLERAIDSSYAGCRPAALEEGGTLKRMVEGNVERSIAPAHRPIGEHQWMARGDEDVPDIEWMSSMGAQEDAEWMLARTTSESTPSIQAGVT